MALPPLCRGPWRKDRQRICSRIRTAMRDGKQDLANVQRFCKVAHTAAEVHMWPACWVRADVHVRPVQPTCPPSAQCFEDCFLGCPATSKMLHGPPASLTIADLLFSKHPAQE